MAIIAASNEVYLTLPLPPTWVYTVPTLAGSPPQWGDASDASYAEVATQRYRDSSDTGFSSGAYTTMPPQPEIPIDAEVAAITVTVRAAHMADANSGLSFEVKDSTDFSTGALATSAFRDAPTGWTFPSAPTTQSLVVPAYGIVENSGDPEWEPSWDVNSRQRLAKALRLGARIQIYGSEDRVSFLLADMMYRVYEVEIGYELYDTAFGLPPLRQVQRSDGLGSSVPRAVQNQSQQASLRAGRAFI